MILLVAPVLIPLASSVGCLLLWRHRNAQRALGLLAAFALLASGISLLLSVERDGIQAVQIANWPAPFGITVVADLLSAIMVTITGVIGSAAAVYSLAGIDAQHESFGFHPLFHFLLMGICGAFLTGDLFNLYVWFEVMLIASFVLLVLGGERQQIEGAFKYVALNLVSSALFLAGVGLLYGATGTLNMADMARRISSTEGNGLVTVIAMLFLTTFGIKAAIFPLFFWLPASYHTPPVAISAVFAGLLTKVGVYAILRVFTLIFVKDVSFTHSIILALAGLTMLTGILGAIVQTDMRRVLSFNLVSHIGYMIMGVGLFSVAGIAGSIFYVIHHIIVKANLFMVSGLVCRLGGSYDLEKAGGLYSKAPGLAVLFLIPALSLSGMPPLSGFFAKLTLVRAGLANDSFWIVGAALVAGLLTLFSMVRVWAAAFWTPRNPDLPPVEPGAPGALWMPVISLGVLTILIGLGTAPVFDLSLRAAHQLMDPSEYINAVLGVRR